MRISNAEALPQLQTILAEQGLRPALIFLNSLTSHRFSALYHFRGIMLENSVFYDRENPQLDFCEEIPITASYCIFVQNTASQFIMHNSLTDARVQQHAKREQVRAYCGVPLFDAEGRMYGSLCHFNIEPTPIANDDVYLLQALAGMLCNYDFGLNRL